MACNCNTADPNCEPCAFCTPPGVTGLTTCQPIDPCDKRLDIGCAFYNGDDYPCLGIQNGNSLFSVIFSVLTAVFPNCCSINGTVVLGNPTLTTTTTTASPTTTSTTVAPSTTTTTTAIPCSFYGLTNTGPVSSPAIISYVPCNTTTYIQIPISTSATICINNLYAIIVNAGTVTAVNSGVCNTPGVPTTTTSTAFSCTCNFWDVTNPFSFPITMSYTACNNGYQLTSSTFPANSVTRVCACNDIINSIPKGASVNNTGLPCSAPPSLITTTTTIAPTTTAPCYCYFVQATDGNSISWLDCNGVTQTGVYSSKSPNYCSSSLASFNIVGFNVITGGTALCTGGACFGNTTTTTTQKVTTTTTRCLPECGAVYWREGLGLYFYNLINPTLGISTPIQIPFNSVSSYVEIAQASGKFFASDITGNPFSSPSTAYCTVEKYNFTLCPTSFTSSVKLTAPAGVHALGLTAKDANTLISTRYRTGLSSMVTELDVSGTSTITSTDKFSLNTSTVRILTGDMYYSNSGVLYTTQSNAAGTTTYLTSYTYSTGVQIAEVDITSIALDALGLGAIGSSIYIFNKVGSVYRVDSMSGGGTFTRMPDALNGILAASSYSGCALPTTSTTAPPTTSTTTLACNCLAFVSTNTLSATYSYTDCFGATKTGTIGALSTLNFCGVPGSATFSRTGITATTGSACINKTICITGPTTTTIAPTTSTTIIPTTTTTKTPTTTSTSSTTTAAPTTSTTTVPPCVIYTITRVLTGTTESYTYKNCANVLVPPVNFSIGTSVTICAIQGSLSVTSGLTISGGTVVCSNTTSTTTNPFTNKYVAQMYSCSAPGGCSNPLVGTVIVTVSNNTLTTGKFYTPIGRSGDTIYQIVGTSTGTPTVVLDKLSESSTCTLACTLLV